MTSSSTHRKPLNSKQLAILRLLYRFRFATTELLTLALETKSKSKMNERLKILLEQEYIGRKYEPEYRLLRKHASYYLLPKGMNALKGSDGNYDKAILHNIHKDKTASDQFIDHSLNVFKVYCDLKAKYEDRLRFFTKSQLTHFDYFPKPLPDAYIRLKDNDQERQYFLEMLQSTRPFFVSIRKVQKFVSYVDEDEWGVTDTDLPTVLLVCNDKTLQFRLEKYLTKLDDNEDLKLRVINSELIPTL